MKKPLSKLFAFGLAFLPLVTGFGHPGHFLLDYTVAPPHTGHQSGLFLICVVVGSCGALVCLSRWFFDRRR